MSEIKPGARVRVTYEAAYDAMNEKGTRWVRSGECILMLPADATVEVISDPLPPEPPRGATRGIRHYAAPCVFTRLDDGLWYAPGSTTKHTWQELCEHGDPVRLYREDEQPQERYEPAKSGFSATFLHSCGRVAIMSPHVHLPDVGCSHCEERGGWERLYVRKGGD